MNPIKASVLPLGLDPHRKAGQYQPQLVDGNLGNLYESLA
jgi:hypothetical protein